MPVVGLRQWVPCPVGCLEILENDSSVLVLFRRSAPDIKVLVSEVITGNSGINWSRCFLAGVTDSGYSDGASRFLEPRILIARVIDHEFGDHAEIALMRGVEKRSEVIERAEIRIYVKIIGNVVAVIAHRRWIERQQPDRRDAEFLQIIQL